MPFFDGVCAENGASPLTPPTSDWNILELDFLGADFSVAAENFQCAVSDTFRALPRIFCFRLPGAAGSGRGWCRSGWEVDVGVGVRLGLSARFGRKSQDRRLHIHRQPTDYFLTVPRDFSGQCVLRLPGLRQPLPKFLPLCLPCRVAAFRQSVSLSADDAEFD